MAGKFVNKETHDLLHGTGTFDYSGWTDNWAKKGLQGYQAWMRAVQLLWPKTLVRNAVTAISGFSFKSGDALRPGYWDYWSEGWVLVRKVMAGDPKAQRTLADLVQKDVFDITQESIIDAITDNLEGFDITQELGETAAKKIQKLPMRKLKKAMEGYALIDLPAKYASFNVNKNRFVKQGMSEAKAEEAAVDHVRTFYQYRDFVPEGIRKMNRLPVNDYFGYTFDSTRIWINATNHAVNSALKGDLVPLVGYMMSATIPVFAAGAGAWSLVLTPKVAGYAAAASFGNLLAALGVTDDDEEGGIRLATNEEMIALRQTLQSYDKFMPLGAYYRKEKGTGKWVLHWQVLQNLSAFPFEDLVIGAIQTAAQMPDGEKVGGFITALKANLKEIGPFDTGMALDDTWKMFTGNEFLGKYKGKGGMFDVISSMEDDLEGGTTKRPDADLIVRERVAEWAMEAFLPGQTASMIRALEEWTSGREPKAGRWVRRKTGMDVLDVFGRMVRRYEAKPEDQARLLRSSIQQDAENLKIAKRMAGTAERKGLEYEDGAIPSEELISRRGVDAWLTTLKRLEGKVANFQTLTRGNFSEGQVVDMLVDTKAMRRSEARAIVRGEVDLVTEEEYFKEVTGESKWLKTDPRPTSAQSGRGFAEDYFASKGKNFSYVELRKLMIQEKFEMPKNFGTWARRVRQEKFEMPKNFGTWARRVRKDWRESQR
jgi:hypothetical protein